MGGEKGEQTQNHRSKQLGAETKLYVSHIRANSGLRLQLALVLAPLIVPSLTSTAAEATACHCTELSYFPDRALSTGIYQKTVCLLCTTEMESQELQPIAAIGGF